VNLSLVDDELGVEASVAVLQATLDAIPDPIFVKNRAHQWVVMNEAFCALLGRPREALAGFSDPDLFPPDQVEVFWRMDDIVVHDGLPLDNEERVTDASGVIHTIWTRKFPIRNASDKIVGLCGIITDITEQRAQHELEQQELIAAQDAQLDALAMPIVELWSGVLLMSLIGEMTRLRADKATQALLDQIVARSARVVLLDLTGMPVVDSQVADGLQRTVRASALLGCETVLCGISPAIAQALVMPGIELTNVTTCGSVRSGLAHALRKSEGR